MLSEEYKKILEHFSKYSRDSEELFAKMLSENHELKLYYINEGRACTDGNKIVVDPAIWELFANKDKLRKIGEYLNWPESILSDPENALQIITRFQTIHECLHLIYTDFPLPVTSDTLPTNKLEQDILATIANIIEDAYIEAAGCTAYDNMKFYLRFGRVSAVFVEDNSQAESIDEKERRLASLNEFDKKMELLKEFMNYFISTILYPISPPDDPANALNPYIDKSTPLFKAGCINALPGERYKKAQEIFMVIRPLIPSEEEVKEAKKEQNSNEATDKSTNETVFPPLLNGSNTHSPKNNPMPKPHKGKSQEVTKSPFGIISVDEKEQATSVKSSEEPIPKSPLELLTEELQRDTEENMGFDLFESSDEECELNTSPEEIMPEHIISLDVSEDELKAFMDELASLKADMESAEKYEKKDYHIYIPASDYKGSTSHKGITIDEFHPAPDKSFKDKYEAIYKKFKSSIDSYAGKFLELLKTSRTIKEGGHQFGSGIVSSKIGDAKKRYWYRNQLEMDSPDLSVLILIDGSGSMSGEKQEKAIESALILHEVLKRQAIPHSIIEHNAPGATTKININILIDFFAKQDAKLNILRVDANYCNRDGLALLWAERHLAKIQAENKLLLVISDGQPYHPTRDEATDYRGLPAINDTAKIVKQINKRGINVIGIALEDDTCGCYDSLRAIYPNLVKCDNLKELTKKLLNIIVKIL